MVWGHSEESVAKVSWQSSCLPKPEGGLGLRNFEAWNKALNLKLVWLLFASTTSLWVVWMREHKLKRRNFWSLEAKETDSWIWKTLLSLWPLASKMLSCRVGDGRRISFWYDNWSIHGLLIRFIGSKMTSHNGYPGSNNRCWSTVGKGLAGSFSNSESKCIPCKGNA